MSILPSTYETAFMTFFFVYVRVSSAVLTTPILSNTSVSRPIKAGIAFWITIVLLGPVWGLNTAQTGPVIPLVARQFQGFIDFSLAVAGEVLVGMTLGFIAQVFLNTIGIAGEIIGQQAGFSAASVFDPLTGQDIFLMAQIQTWIGTLVFLVLDGPIKVLEVLSDSFNVLAPGEGFPLRRLTEAGYETLLFSEGQRTALASIMFKVGVQLAAPMIAAMILISLAEAFIARTVPQLNVMAISFAVRIGISLLFIFSLMRFSLISFGDYLSGYTHYAQSVLQRLAPF